MTEPRIITPEEAQQEYESLATFLHPSERERFRRNLAHTVATEPDRTRAAVVKALRARSKDTRIRGDIGMPGQLEVWEYLSWWANKIEGGAPL